jgi:hypothetical protein
LIDNLAPAANYLRIDKPASIAKWDGVAIAVIANGRRDDAALSFYWFG